MGGLAGDPGQGKVLANLLLHCSPRTRYRFTLHRNPPCPLHSETTIHSVCVVSYAAIETLCDSNNGTGTVPSDKRSVQEHIKF